MSELYSHWLLTMDQYIYYKTRKLRYTPEQRRWCKKRKRVESSAATLKSYIFFK